MAAPTPTPPGWGVCPICCSASAELPPGRAARRRGAGREAEQEPLAGSHELCRAGSAAPPSHPGWLPGLPPAPPAARSPLHPTPAIGAQLILHFIWEEPEHGDVGEIPGEGCCVTQNPTP